MSGLFITPSIVEQWRSRALQILQEIGMLKNEGRRPLSLSGPDSRDGDHTVTSAKISELRAELRALQSNLLRATCDDPS